MKTLYLIDNSNFCYKYKSVYKFAKINVSGIDIDKSVITGYLRSLKANLATDICIVLDGLPENSLNLLPSYKGQRNNALNVVNEVSKVENIQFLTQIGKLINKNIFVVCAPGQEADQVISSITHIITGNVSKLQFMLSKNSESDIILKKYLDNSTTITPDFSNYDSVVIASTDSDMHQLLRFDNVFMDSSTCGKNIYRDKTPKAVHGMNPYSMILYKTIYGDISDNVPSLKLSLKKDRVIKLLNSLINSNEFLNTVIEKFRHKELMKFNSDLTGLLSPIFDELLETNQYNLFFRNLDIVKLSFYSVPIMLTYPKYNIQDTITKYNIKL